MFADIFNTSSKESYFVDSLKTWSMVCMLENIGQSSVAKNYNSKIPLSTISKIWEAHR